MKALLLTASLNELLVCETNPIPTVTGAQGVKKQATLTAPFVRFVFTESVVETVHVRPGDLWRR